MHQHVNEYAIFYVDFSSGFASKCGVEYFYSHSNYITLYQEYAKENQLSMDIDIIPTLSDAIKNTDLMNFIEMKGGLKTGSYDTGYLEDK